MTTTVIVPHEPTESPVVVRPPPPKYPPTPNPAAPVLDCEQSRNQYNRDALKGFINTFCSQYAGDRVVSGMPPWRSRWSAQPVADLVELIFRPLNQCEFMFIKNDCAVLFGRIIKYCMGQNKDSGAAGNTRDNCGFYEIYIGPAQGRRAIDG